jgi:hypothetical protein
MWPDTLHDALAVAGKEMSRLGEDRQRIASGFANWLTETLQIDEARFTGMTYLRGSQATFDQMGWQRFRDLLIRNRRSCSVDPSTNDQRVKREYDQVAVNMAQNRSRFSALDAAIDGVLWRLVGLELDGTLPQPFGGTKST